MRIQSELLKEAIADAKAVRVTAYANAKASLQERFDKRFEAVFADKLREDAEEEEDGLQEVEAPNQVQKAGGEAKGPSTKPVSKGQPGKKKSGTDFKPVQAGEGPKGVGKLHQPIMETSEEEEEEGKKMDEQYEEEEEAKMDEAGLTSEDLDEIIKELEAEVAGEEEGRKVEEPVDVPPGPEGEPAPEGEPHAEEEPGEEPEGEPEAGEVPPTPEPEEEPYAEEEPPVDVTAEPGAEVNVGPEAGEEPPVAAPGVPTVDPRDDQEEINLEELLAALNEEAEEEEEEEEGKKMDEVENHGVPKTDQESKATVKGYPKTGPEKTSPGSTQVAGKNHNISGKGNIGTGAVAGSLKEVAKYKTALKEAYDTIEFLRGQINEVNLMNAKLLYTNKLFREFATVIDDPYRMKIVEAFDLTKSVREVKLAYALLAESLNFGSKKVVASESKRPAKQVDPAKKAIAKQITEGLASKPVSSTKPTQEVISESAKAQVARLQKLAGIKLPVEPKK